MRFRMYQISYLESQKEKYVSTSFKALTGIDFKQLFEKLNKLPLLKDEDKSEYTVLYCKRVKHIILGSLVQSFDLSLTKFIGGSKQEKPIDESKANDKTYFYIDTKKGHIYLQNRRYQLGNLNSKKTFDRIENILDRILKPNIDSIIKLFPLSIEYSIEELEEIFKSSFVKYVELKNLQGLEIPKGSVLHNPREYLDESLIESWNTYSSDVVNSMELKAANGKSLNKNPFAKIGFVLGKEPENENIEVVKKLTIVDSEGEETLKPKDNEHKIINIPKKAQTDSFETYEYILKSTLRDYAGRH